MNYSDFSPEKIYWSITEVVKITGVKAHTLRYWEKIIPAMQVPKNRANRRTYRKQDIQFILALKDALKEDSQNTIQNTAKSLNNTSIDEAFEKKDDPSLSNLTKLVRLENKKIDGKPALNSSNRDKNESQKTPVLSDAQKRLHLQNLRLEVLDAMSRLKNAKK